MPVAESCYRFQAIIYRIWMMRHVNVPNEIARRLQKQLLAQRSAAQSSKPDAKYIPVLAVVNGARARTTLVPAGAGRFRMQINTALRKAAGADVGELVGVELRLDLESRELPVPSDLRVGLRQHPKAWKAFEALAPGHRRHFIAWFDSAKSEAARGRRLARAIDVLLERAMLGPKRQRVPARNRRVSQSGRSRK
ncbi:MAG TPA: YdeI/OmpD-associated family protein [Candidatus Acidoferrales bacterium]|nr:YdeI/OmpD-associated family protein [Candidatus Acidoferrales bacterium]